MHFVPLAFAGSCNLPECGAAAGGSAANRFYAYGVIARLALLASAVELERTAHRVGPSTAPVAAAIAG
jgi:glutamate--cysteine ligase